MQYADILCGKHDQERKLQNFFLDPDWKVLFPCKTYSTIFVKLKNPAHRCTVSIYYISIDLSVNLVLHTHMQSLRPRPYNKPAQPFREALLRRFPNKKEGIVPSVLAYPLPPCRCSMIPKAGLLLLVPLAPTPPRLALDLSLSLSLSLSSSFSVE